MRLFNLFGIFMSLYISVILMVTIILTNPFSQPVTAVSVGSFNNPNSKIYPQSINQPRWTASDRLSNPSLELISAERIEFEEEYDEKREALYDSLKYKSDKDGDNTS